MVHEVCVVRLNPRGTLHVEERVICVEDGAARRPMRRAHEMRVEDGELVGRRREEGARGLGVARRRVFLRERSGDEARDCACRLGVRAGGAQCSGDEAFGIGRALVPLVCETRGGGAHDCPSAVRERAAEALLYVLGRRQAMGECLLEEGEGVRLDEGRRGALERAHTRSGCVGEHAVQLCAVHAKQLGKDVEERHLALEAHGLRRGEERADELEERLRWIARVYAADAACGGVPRGAPGLDVCPHVVTARLCADHAEQDAEQRGGIGPVHTVVHALKPHEHERLGLAGRDRLAQLVLGRDTIRGVSRRLRHGVERQVLT